MKISPMRPVPNNPTMSKKILLILLLTSLIWANSLAQTFYGTTRHGGTNGGGTIYKINGDGTGISTEYNFLESNAGRGADFSVMLAAPGGLLYGTTRFGGITDNGVLFSYNPTSNAYTVIFHFDHLVAKGSTPIGKLVLFNGLLYGVTHAGGNNYQGTIFTVNPTSGLHEKLFDFETASGVNPFGGLTLGPDNMLYGMTSAGGGSNGTLYQLNPATKDVTVKHSFDNTTGAFPLRELTLGTNNLLYGMTVSGGANDKGVLFEYNTTTGVLTKKVDFDASTIGSNPIGSLLQSTVTGKFYGGTASGGVNDAGTLFEYDPTTSGIVKKVDFEFTASGRGQINMLARLPDDKMYGTTEVGGTLGAGVIFEFIPATGVLTKKFDLDGFSQGYSPKSGLTLASNGNFYGMTAAGGFADNGTLFEWNPGTNAFVQKISFKVSPDGITPENTLVQAPNGKLLGVTVDGGTYGGGVLFEFDPLTKVYTKKVEFNDYTNTGGNPFGGIVAANNGKYYGVTSNGGTGNTGVLYEYNYGTNGFTKKVDFTPVGHGSDVIAPMIILNDVAYGVASNGGTNSMGTIFEYNYVLETFQKTYVFGGTDGANPVSPMMLASDGMMYGVTLQGGNTNNEGVLYQYNPVTHAYNVKVVFDPQKGTRPEGGLLEVGGKLYGVTVSGGGNNRGTLFEYDLATTILTKKVDMDFKTAEAKSTLVRGAGKKLYGWTEFNGDFGTGVIYEYDIDQDKLTVKNQFLGANGAHPGKGALLPVKLPPVVSSFSPGNGTVNSTVHINGSNFSGNISENIVYFGAVKATVTAATPTELTVTVPSGQTFQPVSVTVKSLTGYAPKPFITTFPGGQAVTSTSFEPVNDFETGSYPIGITAADLDNDGRTEIIVANHTSNSISVFPNLAIPGKLAATSLGTRLDFGVNADPIGVAAGDIDGDGKLDVVVTNTNNTLSVFRNLSTTAGVTAGVFGARVDFTVGNNSYDVAIGDIDGDGRNDIVTANLAGPSISVLRNTTTPGTITGSSFAPKVDIATSAGVNSVKIRDIDGDTKPEVIVGYTGGGISVFRNLSTPGGFVAGSLAAKVDFATTALSGISIGDMDGDGKPDIAASTTGTAITLFKNASTPGTINGSSFAAGVNLTVLSGPYGSFADVDGDGKIDLVVSSRADNSLAVWRNTSTSSISFAASGTVITGNGPGISLAADLDNDGKPDFVTVNNTVTTTNRISVIHNNILAAEPSQQPSTLSFTDVTTSGMTVIFNSPAAGADGYLIVMSNGVAPIFDPTDGIAYEKNTIVGQVSGANMVIAYRGPNTTFPVTDLAPGTNLHFRVFAYKGAASIINYFLPSPLTGSRSTLATQPSTQVTNVALTPAVGGGLTVSFTNGSGTSRLVVLRAANAVDALPVNGTSYSFNNNLALAPQLGTGNFIVGNSNPSTITGLAASTVYHLRVFEFNGSGGAENYLTATATGNPAIFTPDATPPVVVLIPTEPTASGAQVNVSATVTDDGSPITDVTLYYRSIATGGVAATKKMDKGTGDNYSASIEAAAVGVLGVEYKIRATSSGGTSADPKYTAIPVTAPNTGTTISYEAYGDEQQNYRIIAVPLSLTSKAVSSVFAQLGGTDRTKWRLSHYENGTNREMTASDQIEPGKGYWLIVKTAGGALTTGSGSTVNTTSDENFSVPLVSGWNQIGNPYPFNLAWSDVVAANPGLPTLRTFRADNPSGGDYPWGDGSVLRAKEGGFINNTGGLSVLKFPVLKSLADGRVQEPPFASNPLTEQNWQVYIFARHNDLVNRISGIGMRENASELDDAFDGYTMPRFFDRYVELSHKKNVGEDRLSMDIVPTASEYTWAFDVESSEADQYVTLEWDNTHFGENDLGLVLWDEARQYGVDMRGNSSYTFDRAVSKEFKVYYGNASTLSEKIEISGLVMHSVSPNPAEGAVRIAFSVPRRQEVEFEALDLLGRPAWHASDTYEKGYHEVVWEGDTRSSGHGFFIIRVKSGSESLASRIYLK